MPALLQDPPAPPTPVAPAAPPAPTITITQGQGPTDPAEVYRAAKAQKEVLNDQLHDLEQKREELTEQVRELRNQGLDITGLEARVKDIDARIKDVDQQIAAADLQVARAASVAGAVRDDHPPPQMHDGPPDGVFVLGGFFIVFVMMPVAVAFARRIWKRTAGAVAAIPSDVSDRLRAIEHAVESVALEVERIGEGQRFMSRLFTDRQLAEGAVQPIDVQQRPKVAEQR